MMGRTLTHPAASFYGEAILLCFAVLSVNIAEASWGSSEREDGRTDSATIPRARGTISRNLNERGVKKALGPRVAIMLASRVMLRTELRISLCPWLQGVCYCSSLTAWVLLSLVGQRLFCSSVNDVLLAPKWRMN